MDTSVKRPIIAGSQGGAERQSLGSHHNPPLSARAPAPLSARASGIVHRLYDEDFKKRLQLRKQREEQEAQAAQAARPLTQRTPRPTPQPTPRGAAAEGPAAKGPARRPLHQVQVSQPDHPAPTSRTPRLSATFDRLVGKAKQYTSRREELAREVAEQRMQECTFTPNRRGQDVRGSRRLSKGSSSEPSPASAQSPSPGPTPSRTPGSLSPSIPPRRTPGAAGKNLALRFSKEERTAASDSRRQPKADTPIEPAVGEGGEIQSRADHRVANTESGSPEAPTEPERGGDVADPRRPSDAGLLLLAQLHRATPGVPQPYLRTLLTVNGGPLWQDGGATPEQLKADAPADSQDRRPAYDQESPGPGARDDVVEETIGQEHPGTNGVDHLGASTEARSPEASREPQQGGDRGATPEQPEANAPADAPQVPRVAGHQTDAPAPSVPHVPGDIAIEEPMGHAHPGTDGADHVAGTETESPEAPSEPQQGEAVGDDDDGDEELMGHWNYGTDPVVPGQSKQ